MPSRCALAGGGSSEDVDEEEKEASEKRLTNTYSSTIVSGKLSEEQIQTFLNVKQNSKTGASATKETLNKVSAKKVKATSRGEKQRQATGKIAVRNTIREGQAAQRARIKRG